MTLKRSGMASTSADSASGAGAGASAGRPWRAPDTAGRGGEHLVLDGCPADLRQHGVGVAAPHRPCRVQAGEPLPHRDGHQAAHPHPHPHLADGQDNEAPQERGVLHARPRLEVDAVLEPLRGVGREGLSPPPAPRPPRRCAGPCPATPSPRAPCRTGAGRCLPSASSHHRAYQSPQGNGTPCRPRAAVLPCAPVTWSYDAPCA